MNLDNLRENKREQTWKQMFLEWEYNNNIKKYKNQ